jgi:ribosome-binding ATPase YchF (GTP1/OBG family)
MRIRPRWRSLPRSLGAVSVVISAAIEAEVSQLGEEAEKKEFLESLGLEETGLARVIRAGYGLLGLLTFFTVGPKEDACVDGREGLEGAAGCRGDSLRF